MRITKWTTGAAGLAVLSVALLPPGAAVSARAARSKPPVAIRVVLPHGYARTSTRWPVVYDLNTVLSSCPGTGGKDCHLQQKIVNAAAKEPFITIFQTRAAALSDYVNWADGSEHNDAKYVALFSWVDHHYRTIPNRSHRALGGVSAGAYGAFVLAARHSQLFGQVGSISGPLDIRGADDSFEPIFVNLGGPSPTTGVWGTPVVDDATWKAANPTDLAARLKGMKVWVANANGVPCDAEDGPQANPIGSFIESIVGIGSANFVRAAKAAGVAVTYRPERCGVHTYRYFAPRTIAWLHSLRF